MIILIELTRSIPETTGGGLNRHFRYLSVNSISTDLVVSSVRLFSLDQVSILNRSCGSGVNILRWDDDASIICVGYLQRMLPGDAAARSEPVTSYDAGPMADP